MTGVSRAHLLATLFTCGLLASCRSAIPPGPIDFAMAACVPPGTVALAGLNLEQLRASPLYQVLPQGTAVLLEPFHDARSLLAAYSGKDLLLISRGVFTAPPAGAILVSPGLALVGSARSVEAAQAQYKTGMPGEAELVAQAQSVAGGPLVWILVRGDTVLPLTGNAANVNRLLRNMEFGAITVSASPGIDFAIAARGKTSEAARHFEETLRAAFTMAAAGEARQSELAAVLRSIQVHREDRSVRASLSTNAETARKLLEMSGGAGLNLRN